MSKEQITELLKEFVKENTFVVFLFVLGFALLLIGMTGFTGSQKPQIVLEKEEETVGNRQEIIVDVGGAVISPGVYKISGESRIHDVLVIAGGLSEDADREFVEKKMNLAQKVSDGVKIYIPRKGEAVSTAYDVLGIDSKQVNINSAGISELDSLPGIGPVTGQKIIDNRPYVSADELLNRKIVSASVYEKIKELITY